MKPPAAAVHLSVNYSAAARSQFRTLRKLNSPKAVNAESVVVFNDLALFGVFWSSPSIGPALNRGQSSNGGETPSNYAFMNYYVGNLIRPPAESRSFRPTPFANNYLNTMSSRLASRHTSIAPPRQPSTRLATNTEALSLATRNTNFQTQERSVPQLVAAQAAATPDAPALLAGAQLMTYRELNTRANQLAHSLIALGVGSDGADSIVGLCLNRSLTAVVCALGILKAGAAYLPLDPAYPVERLAFMLNDAQPRVLITSKAMAEQLPAGSWKVIAIDETGEFDLDEVALSRQSTESPVNQITPEQLAYVIYTSGSTGRPKGVEISHANLMNLVFWHQSAFEVTPGDLSLIHI